MENLEGDWNVHKKRMKIEKAKGGVRKQIPKSNKKKIEKEESNYIN
jgi:hypothetical protein